MWSKLKSNEDKLISAAKKGNEFKVEQLVQQLKNEKKGFDSTNKVMTPHIYIIYNMML